MAIRVTLEDVLARSGRKAKEIASEIGVSETHMSLFRSGKVKGVRFETLARLCRALKCDPGDILKLDDSGDG